MTTFTIHSGGSVEWKAVFEGRWDELSVDGIRRKAVQATDDAARPVSWITVRLSAGQKAVVTAS